MKRDLLARIERIYLSHLAHANQAVAELRLQIAEARQTISLVDASIADHDQQWRLNCRAGVSPARLQASTLHHQQLASRRASLLSDLADLERQLDLAHQHAQHSLQKLEQHREAIRRVDASLRRARLDRDQRNRDELASYKAWHQQHAEDPP